MRLILLIGLIFSSAGLYAANEDFTRAQIEQRIAPLGRVHIQGDVTPSAVSQTNSLSQEPGQLIYKRYCLACHHAGLAGAPKTGDTQAWDLRLRGKTLDYLAHSAIMGKNAMPAKGTCYSCSQDDLKAAINYMYTNHD